MEWHSDKESFHSLLSAVIETALSDIKGTLPCCRQFERDRAMAFVIGDLCAAFCAELNIDHEAIKEKATIFYRK